MSSYMAKAETTQEQWYIIDAKGQTLGRLCTKIAMILRGKHRPEFTPHADIGDHLVVINAEKVKVTGSKADGRKGKIYYRHTGHPGGLKMESFSEMISRVPARVIEIAVKGMLPKSPLGRKQFTKLKVYAGDQHPHHAQQPKLIELKERH